MHGVLQEAFARQSVEQAVDPAAAGEKRAGCACEGVAHVRAVMRHCPHPPGGEREGEDDVDAGIQCHHLGDAIDCCDSGGVGHVVAHSLSVEELAGLLP